MKFGLSFDPGGGLPRQSYTRAERPLAALVGVHLALNNKRYTGFGVTPAWVQNEAVGHQIPADRIEVFANAVAGDSLLYSRGWLNAEERHMGLPYKLDEYQIAALMALRSAGGVLAMGCGLGKTLTAVAAAKVAAATGKASKARCWVLCPLNAMGAWEEVRAILSLSFDEVEILSMDSAHKVVGLNPVPGGVIIYDEAHMLGAVGARRTKAAHQLRGAFEFGLALTGTLLHAGIGKALSVMDLGVPGLAGFTREDAAAEFYSCIFPQEIDMGGRKKTVLKIEKPTGDNRAQFMRYIERRVVSMAFESVEVKASVSVPQQHMHRIRIGTPWPSLDDLAVEYIRQQMALGFEIPTAAEVAHALCRTGAKDKIDWLLSALDGDMQVVVAAVYHETLDACSAAFEEQGISFVRIDGTVTGDKRIELVKQFQRGEAQIFLGQMDAAGVSINLQNATISVALEHSWKAASYAQYLARTRRRGQDNETYHFDLVANSLQARIAGRVADAADFDASLAEWQSLKRLRDNFPLDSE